MHIFCIFQHFKNKVAEIRGEDTFLGYMGLGHTSHVDLRTSHACDVFHDFAVSGTPIILKGSTGPASPTKRERHCCYSSTLRTP